MDRRPPRHRKGRPKGGKGGKPRPGRRTPPPPGTGEEARYLNELKQAKTPLFVTMADGEEFRGVLEEVDRDQITLGLPAGSRVLRKQDIRYIRESDEG